MRTTRLLLFLAAVWFTAFASADAAETTSDLKDHAQKVFRKGKNFYDQGRYSEAFREWDTVLPSLEGQSVKKTIEFLKSRVKDVPMEPAPAVPEPSETVVTPAVETAVMPAQPPISEVKGTAQTPQAISMVEASKEATPQVQAPKGMKDSLDVAENKIKERNQAATRETVGLRKEKERALKIQKEIDASFEKGKKAFEKGKIDQAAVEWERILPHLDDSVELKRRLESLRRSQRHLASLKALDLRTQKAGEPALQTAAISKQIKKILEDSNAKLVTQAKEEMKSRQALELEILKQNEETVRLQKDFESGRDLLRQGHYDRAAQVWEKILPSLGSREELKEKLVELKENSRRVKEISALLAAKEPETLRLEAAPQEQEINELLQDASLRLNDEIRELEAKQSAKEGLKAGAKGGREADIEKTFQNGKALYVKGKYVEAVDVWEKVVPYLQNRRLIEDLIRDVRLHSDRVRRLKSSPLKVTAPSSDTRLRQVEIEMEPLLRNANVKLSEESALVPLENHQFYLEKKFPTSAARRKETKKREALERAQAAERKKAWVQSTFADGKSMVESGRTREALLLWGTLTPYLSKEPEMKTYIKKATAAARASSVRV